MSLILKAFLFLSVFELVMTLSLSWTKWHSAITAISMPTEWEQIMETPSSFLAKGWFACRSTVMSSSSYVLWKSGIWSAVSLVTMMHLERKNVQYIHCLDPKDRLPIWNKDIMNELCHPCLVFTIGEKNLKITRQFWFVWLYCDFRRHSSSVSFHGLDGVFCLTVFGWVLSNLQCKLELFLLQEVHFWRPYRLVSTFW